MKKKVQTWVTNLFNKTTIEVLVIVFIAIMLSAWVKMKSINELPATIQDVKMIKGQIWKIKAQRKQDSNDRVVEKITIQEKLNSVENNQKTMMQFFGIKEQNKK